MTKRLATATEATGAAVTRGDSGKGLNFPRLAGRAGRARNPGRRVAAAG